MIQCHLIPTQEQSTQQINQTLPETEVTIGGAGEEVSTGNDLEEEIETIEVTTPHDDITNLTAVMAAIFN
jgi:hypothetical protein